MDERKADELIKTMEDLGQSIEELNTTLTGTSGGLLSSGREGLGEKMDNLYDAIQDLRDDVQSLE